MIINSVHRIVSQCHFITAQFFVHGRRSGVVALQNAMFPDRWLCIRDGKVTVVNNNTHTHTQLATEPVYIRSLLC